MSHVKAEACRLPKAAIQDLAEQLAIQLAFHPGGDLGAVLTALGGRLAYKDFWDINSTDSGSIRVDGPADFEIFVSSTTSGARDRFTIAHEIGHYILHYLYPRTQGKTIDKMYATRYGSEREEWEANWFAASFLMPRDAFIEQMKACGQDLDCVAGHFGVSRKAAEVRVKSLGLTA